MPKAMSWRSSPKSIILSCLIIFSIGLNTVECQEEGAERPKAFAAPTGLNALDIDGTDKAFFKIGPTRDGITRAIADEVSPRIKLEFPPNSPNDSPAYDDNLVEATGEEDLFIPSIYRNETEKEKEEKKTTTTTRAPQTTTQRRVTFGREPLAPTFNTPRPPVPQPPVRLPPAVQTFGGPQPPPRVPLPPAPQQTRTPPPVFQTRPPPPPVPQPTRPPPPPPVFQTRPPPQQFVPQTRPPPPPPVFQTRPPQQVLPQTRPPPPAPVFQTRPPQTLPPAPAPTRPPFQQQPQPLPGFRPLLPIQRPLQPQTLPAFQQPAQPFIPQLRPAQQTRPPPPPTTPRPVFTQPPPPPPQQPQQQQPFRPRPRPAIQPIAQQPQQPTPAPRPLRPFRPAGGRPFRPRPRPQDPTGLRTGFCPFTIFYQSGPAAAFEAQQTYTHFASVVSVDQCARTCHEFKCDAAFFDSANRHCQFNPGQGSNAPPPSCPTYPSPFLRNNVPLSAVPLKITCITCQRRRRINRINGRVFTNRFGQTRRQFNPQVIGRSIANVVHGVLIKQPQSVAIGFGPSVPRQDSFRSTELESLSESLTEEEKRENAAKNESEEKKENEDKKEVEKSFEKEDDEEKPERKINSDMILMNMHKLTSAEASDESKEIISSIESANNLNVIDSSTETEAVPLRASKLPLSTSVSFSTSAEESPLKKHLPKSAGLIKKSLSTTNLHRIAAADKPIESSEDSSLSFA